MRHLPAANFGIRPAGPVEFALVVERRRLGPGAAQQGRYTLRRGDSAHRGRSSRHPCLVRVAAPRDDVHREAAPAQLVEGRQLAGGERRRDEAGSVRQQEPSRSVTVAACAPIRNPSGASEK